MTIPDQAGRRIELTGIAEIHDIGGEEGTKGSYKNDVLRLKNWPTRQAESKD